MSFMGAAGLRGSIAALALVLVASTTGPARAQSSEDTAAALALFREGKELMQQGEYRAAIEKFERSQTLVPNLGTRLNLAACYEKLGKLASAWSHYREAEAMARKRGSQELVDRARASAEALESRLPKLVIRVPHREEIPDIKVARGDRPVDAALFGVAVSVDPGTHRILAAAPGYRAFTTTVQAVEGQETVVEIPMLEAEPELHGTDGVGKPAANPGKAEPGTGHPSTDGPGTAANPGRQRRILGIASMGAGATALVVGLGFGWSARSLQNDAFGSGLCNRDTLMCNLEGQAKMDRAHGHALWANILTGASIVLAGAGVALYLTAPGRREADATALVPALGKDRLGIALSGQF
jgi:hypothetical protein